MRILVEGTTAETLAKRMLYLAWKASKVVGIGVFQDKGEQPEEVVWEAGLAGGKGRVVADYVFGRMMKLYFQFGTTDLVLGDNQWRADYQSFCHKYHNFLELATAAAATLNATVKPEE